MRYLRIAEYRELVERQRDERVALRKRLKKEHEETTTPHVVRLQEINKRARERALLAASLRLHGCLTFAKLGTVMGVCGARARQLADKGFRIARFTGAVI